MKIADLGLSARLERKLTADDLILDTDRLRVLRPSALVREFALTDRQMAELQATLAAHGLEPLHEGEGKERGENKAAVRALAKGRCKVLLTPDLAENYDHDEHDSDPVPCGRPNMKGKQSCPWHWLLRQPIADQLRMAAQRVVANRSAPGFVERPRVAPKDWPPGERFCSDCQGHVPLFYARGSKCYAHASQAAHASMIKRVYDFTTQDYQALLAWQKGRCYICNQVPRSKRLAVDHDHKTGNVRGLLCANDEWGCNVTLRRLLNSLPMATRALEYVTRSPLERMLAGEKRPLDLSERRPVDPFEGFLS